MAATYFTKDFFGFLKELEKNNNREWFAANKARYEDVVQGPSLRFIRDVGPRLKAISPYLVADPKPFGGSMMRIYRDVRFSPDKSPYRTTVGIRFPHRASKGITHHLPGLSLHLQPVGSAVYSGVWEPDPPTLKRIRDGIVREPDAWKRIVQGKLRIEGESLKRPPPGYPPDHPFIRDLARKDFVVSVGFRDAQVTSPDFLDTFLDAGKAMGPLDAFLAKSIGLPW